MSGLSRSILEAGYGLDCLVAQLQGLDLRDPANWFGPSGLEWAATINQVRILLFYRYVAFVIL